jgi:hypothetical protein
VRRPEARMSHDDQSIMNNILSLGEERMGELVTQLLKNDSFVDAMQRAITSSLAAKKSVDKGLVGIYSALNVPTLDDVEELRGKLNEVEDAMGLIEERTRALHARFSDGTGAKSAKKKASRKSS